MAAIAASLSMARINEHGSGRYQACIRRHINNLQAALRIGVEGEIMALAKRSIIMRNGMTKRNIMA